MKVSGAADCIADTGCQAISALRAAGISSESLAEWVPPKRRLLRTAPPIMRPLGAVWRLGVLLLVDATPSPGTVPVARERQRRAPDLKALPMWFIAGSSTRSAERGRPNFQSESREERREIAAAALRGGYPVGSVVHFGGVALPSSDAELAALGPDSTVGVYAGAPRVRWRAGAELITAPGFAQYVAERLELLIGPTLDAG